MLRQQNNFQSEAETQINKQNNQQNLGVGIVKRVQASAALQAEGSPIVTPKVAPTKKAKTVAKSPEGKPARKPSKKAVVTKAKRKQNEVEAEDNETPEVEVAEIQKSKKVVKKVLKRRKKSN